MRFLILIAAVLGLPAWAAAQTYSNAPIMIDLTSKTTNAATQPFNFPEAAVTRIGQDTTGMAGDTPATPTAPQAPAAPTLAPPAAPASPASPPSPVSKLWPRDTVPIFLRACTGYHPELVPACTCVITTLMQQMPHDEFLMLSENNTIEQDPRLITIRQQCVSTPQRKE